MDSSVAAELRRGISGARYLPLLVALLASQLIMPLLDRTVLEWPARAVIVCTILLTGLMVLWPRRRLRLAGLALLVPAFIAPWLAWAVHQDAIRIVGQALAALVLVLATAVLAFDLARETRVTMNTFYAAICGYFMIGVVFGAAYATIEFVAPGSFATSLPGGAAAFRPNDYTYFSLVTLASVGFGDITPVAGVARGLAAVEGVVGQFYIAGIVARIVSLFVMSRPEASH